MLPRGVFMCVETRAQRLGSLSLSTEREGLVTTLLRLVLWCLLTKVSFSCLFVYAYLFVSTCLCVCVRACVPACLCLSVLLVNCSLYGAGSCCIDEFDKMGSQHQSLLEAMVTSSITLLNLGCSFHCVSLYVMIPGAAEY